MLCVIGFSTYTSLPAWQAQIVASECQWFGVASEMASMLLSSRTRRMILLDLRGRQALVGKEGLGRRLEEPGIGIAQDGDLDVLDLP